MTPTYNIQGTVHALFPEEPLGKVQGFTRALLIVETSGMYPQLIRLEAHNKKCRLLKDLTPKQEVEVSFTLKGKCFKGNYFTNAVISSLTAGAQPQSPVPSPCAEQPVPAASQDLPF